MKPPFVITKEMLSLSVAVTEQVTRLELQRERNLHLRKENRIRSIQSSLAIEQNSLSLEQVTDIIDGKRVLGAPKEIREVQNAYEAYERVFLLNPYRVSDLLTAHDIMTKDLVRQSGEFRQQDVGVYDAEGNVVHVGARPQFVSGLIDELLSWAETDDTPMLIKSSVVHFEIEMIHPFPDGNGRMGRLWQNVLLAKWHPVFEWIPVETIVYEHQQEYYEMLAIGDREGDSTKFIEFMLRMILETIQRFGSKQASALDVKMTAAEEAFWQVILPTLRADGDIGSRQAIAMTGRSPQTVRRYLNRFVELGLLIETGANRNRRYARV